MPIVNRPFGDSDGTRNCPFGPYHSLAFNEPTSKKGEEKVHEVLLAKGLMKV